MDSQEGEKEKNCNLERSPQRKESVTLPHGWPLLRCPSIPRRHAVATLVRDVLPLVLERLQQPARSELVVHVVGANGAPGEVWALLAAHNITRGHVTFHGYLTDEQVRLHWRGG